MDVSRVEGQTFKPSGKWAYEVFLDYSDIYHDDGTPKRDGFIDPGQAALDALHLATVRGTSGVRFRHPGDLTLVVFDPPGGYPVMVPGQS
jgi:hypothetical protein